MTVVTENILSRSFKSTKYVCGELNSTYGRRIDEFEEDKKSSSYKISFITKNICLNNEDFKIITTGFKLTKILIEQLIVLRVCQIKLY
ncbi:hypothetical protein RCL_jg16339.t1 [Rhizophagus clarus]|uniref:Uncharacterized protein n=1 Tax=Rhizophagus clarus TaxID=94130 RepID=A0A8H3QZT2_9GLOM|nr:hypothetical protein RCL_jg16339.t1 [Rhizophagus clarus]